MADRAARVLLRQQSIALGLLVSLAAEGGAPVASFGAFSHEV